MTREYECVPKLFVSIDRRTHDNTISRAFSIKMGDALLDDPIKNLPFIFGLTSDDSSQRVYGFNPGSRFLEIRMRSAETE